MISKTGKKKGFTISTGEYFALNNCPVTDKITLYDWLPWGITLEKTFDGRLKNIPPWTENNFCFYASGTSEDAKHTISSSGCFAPQGGKIWKISVDGKWYVVKGMPPIRYDEGEKYPYPTVYSDPAGPHVIAISFSPEERRWLFQAQSQDKSFDYKAELIARGVTGRVGKPEGPFVMMSVASPKRRNRFEVWGGFVDTCTFTGTLRMPGIDEEIRVKGLGWSDREYHKIVPVPEPSLAAPVHEPGSCPLNYWGLSILQDDIDILTFYCTEPWTGEVRTMMGRINFPTRDVNCVIDEFTTTDNGGVNPTEFRIKGTHERGAIDIVGAVIERVGPHTKENVETGQWGTTPTEIFWEGMQVAFWQNFVNWKGEVTLDGETIKVSTIRSPAEVTRMQEPPDDMEPPQMDGSEVEWVYE